MIGKQWLKKVWCGVRYHPPRGMQVGDGTIIGLSRRITGAEYVSVGHRVRIGNNPLIAAIDDYAGETFTPRVRIEDDVYIGPGLYLVCVSSVSIRKGCVLSENVFVTDVSHGVSPNAGLIMRQRLVPGGDIVIGEHSFIGYRCSVMPGVKIGSHCVVGANSVVTKSVPDYCLLVGNPARVIKTYNHKNQQWERV